MLKEFAIFSQKRYQLIEITELVSKFVKESKISDGLVFVFVPHSTCGILLTEKEPNLEKDWINFFRQLVADIDFLHNKIDNNADSHLLSGIMGQGKTLLIKEGNLVLGTWQRVFLTEFDGPRSRKIIIKILSSNEKRN